jgi:UDP-N-acetylmuramoyl-tripeptide--D-alanyl-D-alanine ligase
MGAGRKGDLTYLTGIAPPSIGLVLNVGTAHVARMGRGPEDVAEAKGELVEALPAEGVALLNADDPYVMGMAGRTKAQVVLYGKNADADVWAEYVRMGERARAVFDLVTPSGRAKVRLGVMGEHQVANALAAAAVCTVLGLTAAEIAEGLSRARRRSSGRLEIVERSDGVTIIDDAYNANPESMRAGLRTLKTLAGAGRTVAVLGAMGQQAEASPLRHAEVGRLVAELGIHVLIAVGPGDPVVMAREAEAAHLGVRVHTVEDVAGAVELARELLEPGDTVLVKASSEIGLSACARELAGA